MTKRLSPQDIPEGMELELVGEYYELVPKVPERPSWGYHITGSGIVEFSSMSIASLYTFFNFFDSDSFAKRHRDNIRIQNALATAVEMVEPDFVPSPNEERFVFGYDYEHTKWERYFTYTNDFAPCVSNASAADRVIEILDKWGVL